MNTCVTVLHRSLRSVVVVGSRASPGARAERGLQPRTQWGTEARDLVPVPEAEVRMSLTR